MAVGLKYKTKNPLIYLFKSVIAKKGFYISSQTKKTFKNQKNDEYIYFFNFKGLIKYKIKRVF
jgi:hypothetical protein